uniref:Dolichol-phosphate mannosyltransferase subunit 3 n=1 Tax=Chlamydomonas euryale TaxID=1486919 RepID=A0A7R9V7F1_9CHLO|mmetsp:Transcript_24064/g.71440  ORF Transcript_24064/g.71440 Transcript_24064/m.71440 type:complete len:106 (+) Transcript_24064:88-405(+)
MRRWQRLSAATAAAAVAWLAMLSQVGADARVTVLWAPAAGVVLLGVYLLGRLVDGVLNFPSCPHEERALMQDVKEAMDGLATAGFDTSQHTAHVRRTPDAGMASR